MLLMNKINEKLKDYNFCVILESATYKKSNKTLYLVFLYDNNLMLSQKIKDTIREVVSAELGENANVSIKYKKNYFDESIIQSFVLECLRIEYPFVGVNQETITLQNINDINYVLIEIDTKFKEFINGLPIEAFIKEKLKTEYRIDFEIELSYKDGIAPDFKDVQKENYDFIVSNSNDYEIELDTIEPFIGELIDAPIYPIATYSKPEEGITICGKIESLKENKTKPKTDEKGKEHEGREYYTFDIVDYSGKMRVVYFPGKANLPKFQKLEDGSEIAIFGNLEEDKFSAGLSIRPKVINLCITKKGFYDQIYSLPVPKSYTKIYPEPYTSTHQEDLFGGSCEIKNPYLIENDFVVFDLETTGVNYASDKIIEIGAVKIVQGKITETFGTLINPERHIPEDATKVNNITDEDVKNAPTLKDVMPDFFKFCDGCVLVSYVIGFDFGFIEYHGKNLGYAFTHKTDDAFVMAKEKLKGLKNYKLTTVAKHLNVALENAHRAVFDAVAAAEVMIKLLENF